MKANYTRARGWGQPPVSVGDYASLAAPRVAKYEFLEVNEVCLRGAFVHLLRTNAHKIHSTHQKHFYEFE